jgi:Recombinase
MAERLNFGQACQHAGVSRQRLNEAIRSGRLPAERGGGPGKPTYIRLEDLQAWCVGEGLAMPLEGIERAERPSPQELATFLQEFRRMAETIERLERSVEQAVERLERSQSQAIQQALAETLTQFRASLPIERSGTSAEVPKAPSQDREAIIARIRRAKDVEGKSLAQIAHELNTEGIPTFSGRGTWEKGNVGRFYRESKDT